MTAERCGYSPVTGLGLVYYEPRTTLEASDVDDVLLEDGFLMPFAAHLVELPLEPEKVIPPLLRRAREILDSPEPPSGTEGCKDCVSVDRVVDLLAKK